MNMSVNSNSGRYEGAIKFFTDISKNETVSARGREGATRMVELLTRQTSGTSVSISAAGRNAANTNSAGNTVAATETTRLGSTGINRGIAAYNATAMSSASVSRIRSDDIATATTVAAAASTPAPAAAPVQPILRQAGTAMLAQTNAQPGQVLSLLG